MNETVSRRRTLRVLGATAAVGVAGCTDGGVLGGGGAGGPGGANSYAHLPSELTGELPDPEQFVPEDGSRFERGYVDVRIDTEVGRVVVDRTHSTRVHGLAGVVLADDLTAADRWDGEVDAESGEVSTGLYNEVKELSFAPGTLDGFALRATASANVVLDGEEVASRAATVRYHPDEGRFALVDEGGDELGSDGIPAAIGRDIADPADRIAGRFDDMDRALGRLYVDDQHNGGLSIQSFEADSVTAIEGYVVAEDIDPESTWEGVADAYTHRIGTYVSASDEGLSFSVGTFEGLAVRAAGGIRLDTPDETLVEEATVLRYHPEEGILEQQ